MVRNPIQEYRKGHRRLEDKSNEPQAQPGTVAVPSGASMLPLPAPTLSHVTDDHFDSEEESTSLHSSAASAMVAASARSLGKAVVRSTRGILVDIPLAATEGMRAVPKLWGEEVGKHDHVSDFHSGVTVAGRSFYDGFTSAVKGVFLRTYEGKRDGGPLGAIKGLSQGTVGLVTKTSSAAAGLVAYPAQGISQSIRATIRGDTRRRIIQARWNEGEWTVDSGSWMKDESSIIQDFEGLIGRRR